MPDHLFNKYFIERDTALDELQELEKATEWKRETLTEKETAKIKELVKRYNDMAKQ